MYKCILKDEAESAIDASGTVWFLGDIEHILVMEYGYHKTSQGAIV
jgi:hypothetical protein